MVVTYLDIYVGNIGRDLTRVIKLIRGRIGTFSLRG